MSLTLVAKLQAGVLRKRLAKVGIHEGQALVLAELHCRDGLTQSQLAARLRVEPPTITKILNGLEDGELVVREQDPFDSRARRIRLTARGAALHADLERVWQETEAEAYAGFTEDERAALKELFDRIVAGAAPKLSLFDHGDGDRLGPTFSLFDRATGEVQPPAAALD